MRYTATKAWTAALGATATAITTALATVEVVLDDGNLDMSEYGIIAVAAATLIGTVWGVWKNPNRPIPSYGVTQHTPDDGCLDQPNKGNVY
jgi:hypothetical protein